MTHEPSLPGRRHDLDWLRALAILGVVLFHAAMPYAADEDWHIRNAASSNLLLEFNFFISRFRMAMLFVIAGVSATFVLRRRSPGAFLRDRAKRLLVPLAVGILVIVPPQIYFERLADGAFTGSFLAFWPRTLELRPYPAGDTSYHHLWFIFYLFLYGLLLTPVLAFVRTPRGAAWLARVRARIARHGVHWLAVPIVLTYALLIQRFSGAQNIVDDGAMFLVYFGYFVTGWLLGNDPAIWARLEAGRRGAFTTALLCLLVINGIRWNAARPEVGYTPERLAWLALLGVHAWCWVIAILGYGRRWLDRDHPVLGWARDASYPVYILHQTVIVVIAFYVVRTDETVIAKFLFTAFVSLAVTLALYEAFVRPYPAVRVLFGMSPRPAGAAVPEPRPVRAGAVAAAAILALGVSTPVAAQGRTEPAAAPAGAVRSASVMLGGIAHGDSRLALGKLGLELGRWGVILDATRDATRERWVADGSRGEYTLWAFSAQARRYSRRGGRGFFVEAGAGTADLRFDVFEADGRVVQRRARLPIASWGLGARLGIGGRAGFVELGYRNAIPLAERHLHADATPPAGSRDAPVTYRSWYLGAGRGTGQAYLGIGVSF